MANDAVDFKDMGFKNLMKAFKGKAPYARIGILGGSARNPSEGQKKAADNATIGAAHEFGVPGGVPMRSFLRVPLTDELEKRLESSGAFKEDVLKQVIKERSVRAYVSKIAATAEAVVLEAFATGGFGKWKALSPKTLARKDVKQILVETQQLRNSIVSEVKT